MTIDDVRELNVKVIRRLQKYNRWMLKMGYNFDPKTDIYSKPGHQKIMKLEYLELRCRKIVSSEMLRLL